MKALALSRLSLSLLNFWCSSVHLASCSLRYSILVLHTYINTFNMKIVTRLLFIYLVFFLLKGLFCDFFNSQGVPKNLKLLEIYFWMDLYVNIILPLRNLLALVFMGVLSILKRYFEGQLRFVYINPYLLIYPTIRKTYLPEK